MAFEEKSAWLQGMVALLAYTAYAAVILGRSADVPLAEVPYAGPLLISIGAAIAVSIVAHIAIATIAPEGAGQKDQRDREIERFGDHIGQSLVVVGGVAALILALTESAHFWIANALYLGFVLSALLASTARIVAYRHGFHQW